MSAIIWTISYGPYRMDHIIWFISYGSYHVDHIIWTISYGPYYMTYTIQSTLTNARFLPNVIKIGYFYINNDGLKTSIIEN